LSGRREQATWAAVFALALALRLLYLAAWRDTLLFSTPVGDARAYLEWARAIAGGDWFGREVFYQAPLYPYFLAGVLRATGSESWGPRLVQALMGSLSCVLLGRAAERFFGRTVGVVAGVGLALYAPAIYFDGLIQKPALDSLLLSALLLVLSGVSTPIGVGRALGAGALLGLLGLSRENALVLAPVVALWLTTFPGEMARRRRALAPLAFGLGLALVLVPVGLRNQALGGRFLVTTSQLGPNLWIGNHPGATGRYEPLRAGRGSARYEREDARALAVEALRRELTPAEVSDYWRDRALAFMRAQPLDWLRQLARKAFLVANARELPDTEGIEAYTDESLLLRALFWPLHFGVIAPLAVVGAVARRRDWHRLWLLPAMALALLASVALFYVFARYRYALVPVLMPLAAAGAVALWAAARRRGAMRAVGGLALAGLAGAVVSNWPIGVPKNVGLTHLSVGGELLQAGRFAEAQAEFQAAVAGMPGSGLAHSRLGDALRARGEPALALVSYERAIALSPQLADAHAGRGIVLDALGRGHDAEEAYRRALELDRIQPDANNNLANRLLDEGAAREAIPLYERALAARPDDPSIATNLAAALLRSGDATRALALLDGALARSPKLPNARINRAGVLESLGRTAEARADLELLLAQEPPDSPYARAAQEALARLDGR
jgi:Tfp pilus assembly protein PilF